MRLPRRYVVLAGLKNPNRPVASFIFVGPSGVGKTHLARSLAKFYIWRRGIAYPDRHVRIHGKHNISRLIGVLQAISAMKKGDI